MVDETQQPPQSVVHKRRKNKPNRRPDIKRMKSGPGMGKKAKISKEMKNLYRKRARNYNSDDDEDEDERAAEIDGEDMEDEKYDNSDISDNEAGPNRGEDSDEEHEVRTGITRFSEGCNAFRLAFLSIIKKHTDDEALGPVLSAHKKLVVAKLAEEVTERKVKGEAKKEKQLIEEKGHVKPTNFLDSHEKVLIGVATKGVVKLFNAVNKAQNAQKGLNPSSFKDAKALTKRRKEAFMKELSKASAQSAEATTKVLRFYDPILPTPLTDPMWDPDPDNLGSNPFQLLFSPLLGSSKDGEDSCQPAWAPLRDTYMLTNSKLKDWDKMAVEEEKDMDI